MSFSTIPGTIVLDGDHPFARKIVADMKADREQQAREERRAAVAAIAPMLKERDANTRAIASLVKVRETTRKRYDDVLIELARAYDAVRAAEYTGNLIQSRIDKQEVVLRRTAHPMIGDLIDSIDLALKRLSDLPSSFGPDTPVRAHARLDTERRALRAEAYHLLATPAADPSADVASIEARLGKWMKDLTAEVQAFVGWKPKPPQLNGVELMQWERGSLPDFRREELGLAEEPTADDIARIKAAWQDEAERQATQPVTVTFGDRKRVVRDRVLEDERL